ncbi:MAG TPA: outer membrane lipoprotein-sorting protein [Verrucomicrobiae bacterium]
MLYAATALAQTTNSPSDAQGQQLVQKILAQQPDQDVTNTGVLQIRGANGTLKDLTITFEIIMTHTNWSAIYKATVTSRAGFPVGEELTIVHIIGQTNDYDTEVLHTGISNFFDPSSSDTEAFAGSDFWNCDLGLEFFHWPDQKIIKKEFMRGRGCMVLESTNPNPSPNGYSRVDSWIDEETLGIVHAEAYDASGKLLKIFDPKSFKKVNGQWELQDMEIRNVQTKSRTRIEFDLKAD